ncbi:MAG: MATE family efflux transporter [Eubacteriales bacterium]|nr:MATE family efflux transporter [Sarcina sp.]MBR2730161.1 MATE family efflux transporter [Lachnospiraceae bacterium]MDO4417450.1 MATE family efflux transporter [Eubacteriales bacterium]
MQQNMTAGPILPVILRFTLPLFAGNIFQQFYNMADTIIVGRCLGAQALAAVGATSTVSFLLLGFAMGLATGFAVLTAQTFGAKDERGVRISVANGFMLTLLFSVLLTAAGLAGVPRLLVLMRTPADILPDAQLYMRIICQGLAASMFYNLFSAFLRAVGNSRAPLFFLIFSSCLNILLDFLFIIRFGMGVDGAAFATVLSQGLSAVLCLLYIGARVRVLVPAREHWGIHPEETAHQLRMGIPMALQFAVTASGTVMEQAAINQFGSVAVAAFTAAWRIQNILTQGMVAMGQTMATFCGQNFGSRNLARIREGVRTAVRIEILYSAAAGIASIIFLPLFMRLFFSGDTDLAALMPWARTYTVLCAVFFIPLSFIFLFRNAMQGCSYSFLPLMGGVIEMAARTLCAAAGIYAHSYLLSAGCDGAAWITAGLFTLFAYRYMMRQLEEKQRFSEL